MPTFAGAAVAAQRHRKQRLANARKSKKDHIKSILKDFDASHSGGLKFEELRAWLKALEGDVRTPTDLEVKWVIQLATPEKQAFNGEWISGQMQLEGDALEKACEHWLMYVETYDEIDEIFTKYAARDTDQLSIRELGMVLQDLNHGVALPENEVDEIMSRASVVTGDTISRPGLIKAISTWYAFEEEIAISQTKTDASACCSLQ